MVVIAAMIMALGLGGGFTDASAEATVETATSVEVALTVSTDPGSQVVVHAVDPGGEQRTAAMLEAAPGVYRTRLSTRPIDLVIVFENLGTGEQSDPARLSELGAAPELVGALPPAAPPEAPEDFSLLWLGAGLAAASLSALAFWVLGGDRKRTSGTRG